MGMDQHLCRIRSFKYENPEDVVVTLNGEPVTHVFEIREEVAYWRRGYTIHQWLTKHCGTTEDTFRVKRETLDKLLDLCYIVVAYYDSTTGQEYLGLNAFEAMTTVDQLQPLLDQPEGDLGYVTFEYVAEY